ncbi:MAG: hypothetical protein NC089_09525 [Bacteroides sp.]|nr:hypothetical protein [Bacteroides sp.]MCM1549604.1 hypothetical protein [Clostridium sp.]
MTEQNKVLLEGSLDETKTRANLNKQLSTLTKELQKNHKIKLDVELDNKTAQKSAKQQTKALGVSELIKLKNTIDEGENLVNSFKKNLDHQKVLKTA